MTPSDEVTAAREDVARARTQISDTITEISDRITSPVRAVRQKLDVAQAVNDHPWIALGIAVGAGALLATSGADERAATAVASKAKEAGTATVRLAQEAPSKSRLALVALADSAAAKLASSFIGSLRESLSRQKVEVRTGARFESTASPDAEMTTQL